MKTFDQLAQAAFEAHVKEMANNGAFDQLHPKPNWAQLEPEWKAGWVAVAKQLWAEFAAIH
ncbi:hypothetical protein [Rhodoferax aquaticus]|uniref:Uncharacterized protein n=1 Tax=Rhodoferax aquaticus TaxID=2527691 RepID=A0A515EKD4_9BURK|nr:hypothetical protein [Rhodoferax aquaticus]QDL53127.1 hypothetical protein EXZ61_02490 [Rhodoferax aquaticus]